MFRFVFSPPLQEKAAFYATQVGRSVQDGISDVTIFNEKTPSVSLYVLLALIIFVFQI